MEWENEHRTSGCNDPNCRTCFPYNNLRNI
jgi:hypothetical protein